MKSLFIRVTRVSRQANATTGSYAYHLNKTDWEKIQAEYAEDNKDTPADEVLDLAGITETDDGTLVMYTRSRIGKLNIETKCPFVVRAGERRNGGGKANFVNLVDNSLEPVLDKQYIIEQQIGATKNPVLQAALAHSVANQTVVSMFGMPVTAPKVAEPVAAKEEVPQ